MSRGSFARGFQDVLDVNAQPDLSASNTVQTMGGFVNGSPGHEPLVIGLGRLFRVQEQQFVAPPG